MSPTNTLAKLLYGNNWHDVLVFCERPWINTPTDVVIDAWLEAQTVIKQRDELNQLMPHKKEAHDKQCDELVSGIAKRLWQEVTS